MSNAGILHKVEISPSNVGMGMDRMVRGATGWLVAVFLLFTHALVGAAEPAPGDAARPVGIKQVSSKATAAKQRSAGKTSTGKVADKRSASKTAVRRQAAVRPMMPGGPAIRSSSVLVMTTDDSTVLLSRNAEVVAPIASITKLMTALVVLDAQQSLDEELKITRDDRAVGADHSRLAIGTTLTRGEIMHLALMASENRAAHALGRNYPGGLDAAVRAMNAKARTLGMQHSHFVEPTGLSELNVASPQDLIKLVLAAAGHPSIRHYSTDQEESVKVGRHEVEFRNTNNLVRKPDWDILVQKTGYTQAAGRCLVMQARIDDRPVVMVLLNSFGKYTRVADAARVRKWLEAEAGTKLASTKPMS